MVQLGDLCVVNPVPGEAKAARAAYTAQVEFISPDKKAVRVRPIHSIHTASNNGGPHRAAVSETEGGGGGGGWRQ